MQTIRHLHVALLLVSSLTNESFIPSTWSPRFEEVK